MDDVGATVDRPTARGVRFEHHDGLPQDEHGVMGGLGPHIAWSTDPSGNVLSVIAAD